MRYLELVATEEELREVKRRHSMRLLQLPGVSGVGVEKDSAGNYVLVVHVDASNLRARRTCRIRWTVILSW